MSIILILKFRKYYASTPNIICGNNFPDANSTLNSLNPTLQKYHKSMIIPYYFYFITNNDNIDGTLFRQRDISWYIWRQFSSCDVCLVLFSIFHHFVAPPACHSITFSHPYFTVNHFYTKRLTLILFIFLYIYIFFWSSFRVITTIINNAVISFNPLYDLQIAPNKQSTHVHFW